MPAPVTITIQKGQFAAGLVSPLTAFDCQVASAAITPNVKNTTVKATFCADEAQGYGGTSWVIDLNVLQDWSDPDGICWFAFDNRGADVLFEVALTDDPAPGDANVTMNGTCTVTPIAFGGDAGTPLEGTAQWPVVGDPVKGPAAALLSSSSSSDADPDAE
jgi:hypothetical protein